MDIPIIPIVIMTKVMKMAIVTVAWIMMTIIATMILIAVTVAIVGVTITTIFSY